VQDRSNKEEVQRLQLQDHLLTTAMGGVLPEQPDTLRFKRVLDIGNVRCGCSFLRTWEWPKLLEEMRRVCRAGGILRLTEPELVTRSSSPALLLFNLYVQDALVRAGHLFRSAANGITAHLPRLLVQYGGRRIQAQTRAYSLVFRADTAEGQAFAQDVAYAARTLRAFVTKWCGPSPDYDPLVQQVLEEGQRPDFSATWQLLTAWAVRDEGVSHEVF
jgi:hypothetical protein